MTGDVVQVLRSAGESLLPATVVLSYSAAAFALLALLIKGKEAIGAARRAATEIRINLVWYGLDALFIAPVVAILVQLVLIAVNTYLPVLPGDAIWPHVGRVATFLAVVFIGDFIGYWRHRVEHTRWFWPAHAIHHSDTEMTWLTLQRFHPINRVMTACVDFGCLALFGFPDWAIVAYVMVRHYYGEFIHADLPWMFGPFKFVLVSPVMHRWHHARDVVGAGSNFATVFSVFDLAFGTYHVPGLCTVPLGVTDEMGTGTIRQLLYPFVAWAQDLWPRHRRDGELPEPKNAPASISELGT